MQHGVDEALYWRMKADASVRSCLTGVLVFLLIRHGTGEPGNSVAFARRFTISGSTLNARSLFSTATHCLPPDASHSMELRRKQHVANVIFPSAPKLSQKRPMGCKKSGAKGERSRAPISAPSGYISNGKCRDGCPVLLRRKVSRVLVHTDPW